MRAARLHGPRDLRIEDVDEPSAGPGQIKLRSAYAGICGSDLHLYYAPDEAIAGLSQPHPLTGATLPQILGHEFSGTIVEIGEGVSGVAVGDRVAVNPLYSCGTCTACISGRGNACVMVAFHGLNSAGGGMAEFTTVAAEAVHVLPDSVDLRMGALVEPMAVAWHAVTVSGVQPGQTALVVGGGPIGVGVWFALRARGVERVLVSEPSEARRAAVEALGAQAVDPTSADVMGAVMGMTSGAGVNVAFDAAGAGAAVLPAVLSLRPGARLVVVALHEAGFDFNPSLLVLRETQMVGSLAYTPSDFDEVIAAMAAGRYDPTGWVDVIGLAETTSAIEQLRAGRGMKFLVATR